MVTLCRLGSAPVERHSKLESEAIEHLLCHQHLCCVTYRDCFVTSFCVVSVVVTLSIPGSISKMACQIKFKFGMWM